VKPHWWQITLLVLQAPPAKVTWILREEYIDGGQYTMGGEPMRLERLPAPSAGVPTPEIPSGDPEDDNGGDSGAGGAKVVSLTSRRKKS